MSEEFSIYEDSKLTSLLKSCYFENPSIQSLKKDAEYCQIRVIDCSYEFWWYNNLIGYDFFCRIRYNDYGRGRFISEFVGVKLSKNKEIVFKTFKPSDVIII